MTTPKWKANQGRLTPAELAEVAVMADLAVLVTVLARLTPFSGLTIVFGAIPFALLGMRNRLRASLTAFFVAVILVFLLAGFNAATQVLVMASFGTVVGRGFAEGWSRARLFSTALFIGWSLVASLTVAFLWVFEGLREVNLEAVRVNWQGIANGLRWFRLGPIVDPMDRLIEWAIEYWYISAPVFQFWISILLTTLIIQIGRPVIDRVQRAFGIRPEPAPQVQAMAADLRRHPGTLTLVVGPNGSGKTTLLRAIADVADDRGLPGGTAVVGQRPESQVIGIRVLDDLAWGLTPEPTEEAMRTALTQVGLAGFEERETGGLSGGELQRLALAAAILREPAVLLSDESTAMIDPAGRDVVVATLRRLAERGVAVVHVSHVENERAIADRVIEL